MPTDRKIRIRKERRNIRRSLKAKLSTEMLFNRHHIIPVSRNGESNRSNIIRVDVTKHRKYHELFSNKTPDEIINYLIDYFWNGQTGWVFEAIANREEVGNGSKVSNLRQYNET